MIEPPKSETAVRAGEAVAVTSNNGLVAVSSSNNGHVAVSSSNHGHAAVSSNSNTQVTFASESTPQVAVTSDNIERDVVMSEAVRSTDNRQSSVSSNNNRQLSVSSNNNRQLSVSSNNNRQLSVYSNNNRQLSVCSNNNEQSAITSVNKNPNNPEVDNNCQMTVTSDDKEEDKPVLTLLDENEIIYTVMICHAVTHIKALELDVLGSQTLADLRDSIKCVADVHFDGELYKGGVFFINGVLYSDVRLESMTDYSSTLGEWLIENDPSVLRDFRSSVPNRGKLRSSDDLHEFKIKV
eukprot:GHVL01026488.1.p1 GENE.GHVL01026488.1~~GHVL01026488.1.p1  ORF type:complete len:295 (+),score=71.23 GHVL01026488.1:548-1432(+)